MALDNLKSPAPAKPEEMQRYADRIEELRQDLMHEAMLDDESDGPHGLDPEAGQFILLALNELEQARLHVNLAMLRQTRALAAMARR